MGVMKAAAMALIACVRTAAGQYMLSERYVGEDFFSRWTFWDKKDPTSGTVEYVGREEALAEGLAKASSERVYLGADMTEAVGESERGRRSVRIQSRAAYNEGLFVAKFDHVPTGCGVWPAFWMYGEDERHIWPQWGEYDIVEGVHGSTQAMTSLHSSRNCHQQSVIAGKDFSGQWDEGNTPGSRTDSCFIDAPKQWENQGCSQHGPIDSMGATFNALGGGTYAAQWAPRSGYIRTWYWPTGSEPVDLQNGNPEPDSWGTPYSYFSIAPEDCSADHFVNMRLVFTLTFCGDLGDSTFAQFCPSEASAMSCSEFVRGHPQEMTEAYWSIRGLDVYQWMVAPAGPTYPPDVTFLSDAHPGPFRGVGVARAPVRWMQLLACLAVAVGFTGGAAVVRAHFCSGPTLWSHYPEPHNGGYSRGAMPIVDEATEDLYSARGQAQGPGPEASEPSRERPSFAGFELPSLSFPGTSSQADPFEVRRPRSLTA